FWFLLSRHHRRWARQDVSMKKGAPARADAPRCNWPSPLDTHHLLQRVHDLHEIALRFHHGVDVLVGRGRLVDDVLVLAAFDAFRGGAVVGEGEAALRLAAAHHAARAVRAAIEAVRVALAAHDVAARAHAARDDPELPGLRAHRALAGDVHVLSEVVLLLD